MEKFLFTFKLAKGAKFIGWFKFVVCCFVIVVLLIGSVLSTAVLDVAKKTLKSESDSSSNFKFYFILILTVIYIVFYAIFSFVLIIATINHDRSKVLSFLIFDGTFTILMLYVLITTFPSLLVILVLVVQGYLIFSIYSYWRELQKEDKSRQDSQAIRARFERNQEPLRQVTAEEADVGCTEPVVVAAGWN